MDINDLETPEAVVRKVEGGTWIDEIPECPGLRLRVRGIGAKMYQAELSARLRDVPRKERDRNGLPNLDAHLRAQGIAAAKQLLLEWEGLESNGEPVPYDPQLAKKLLTNPRGKLLDAVVWAARVADNEASDIADDIEKN